MCVWVVCLRVLACRFAGDGEEEDAHVVEADVVEEFGKWYQLC